MDLRFTLGILLVVAGLTYTNASCKINGVTFEKGEKFTHPEEDADQCKVCVCCENGEFTCTKRKCTVPQCGVNMQVRDDDGCCMVCKPECDDVTCTSPSCPLSRQAFLPDSCCPSCGCEIAMGEFPVSVVPVGGFGACDRCTCFENGSYSCNTVEKPSPLMQCVNPRATLVGQQCTFDCPDGETCRRSHVLLKRGQFTKIGYNYCTCHSRSWYPRGFCIYPRFMDSDKRLKALQDEMCVAKPTLSDLSIQDITYIDYLHYFKSL